MSSPFKASDDELAFFEIAEQNQLVEKEKNQEPSRARSIFNSALRGGLSGLRQFGRAFGPLQPQTLEEEQKIEQFPERLQEFFPTQDGFIEGALEKTLTIAPSALTAPGASAPTEQLVRSLVAGISGQGAKELGFGETGQALAEIPAFITPNVLNPRIAGGGQQQQQLVNFLREQGLTEQQIAPLIQDKGKFTAFLARFSPKRGRAERALEGSRQGIGQLFENVKTSPQAAQSLSSRQQGSLINDINNILNDVPFEQRNRILGDFNDLMQSNFAGNDLINFFQDINDVLGGKSKQLSRLKRPIVDALRSISPDLAENFQLTNRAASNFFNLQQRLTPSIAQDIFSGIRALRVVGGLTLGQPAILAEAVSETAAKTLSRELLINPRFQNLSSKFVTALNNNSPRLAKSAINEIQKMVREFNPELADEIQEIDIEAFLNEAFDQE